MAVQLTKEFWTNLVLFVVACVALGLSIWALNVPCKKDGFGDNLSGCKKRSDCSENQYCDYKNHVCQDIRKPGDKCNNPYECLNSWCIDGQCRHENELYCECGYAIPPDAPATGPIKLKKVGPGYCNVTPGHIECLHKEETGAYSSCYNGPDLATASKCIAKLYA